MKTTKTLMMTAAMITAVVLLSFSFKEKKAPATKTADMIADWERAKSYTLDFVNASTDEVIGFKPTPEMRTFGQQMLHLAEGNYNMAAAISGKPSPVSFGQLEKSDQYKTKEAVKKAVTESYDFMISALKGMDDNKLTEMIKLFNFDVSRGGTANKAFEHQTHHRGQTVVYLRLKGIKPPDERLF